MTRRGPALSIALTLVLGALVPAAAAAAGSDAPSPRHDGRRRRLDHPGRQHGRRARAGRAAELVVDRTSTTVNSHYLRLRALEPAAVRTTIVR